MNIELRDFFTTILSSFKSNMNFLRTVIFVTACLCCTEFVSAITENDANALIEQSGIKQFIAQKVAQSFLIGLKRRDGKESRDPVLPDLPDPLLIDDVDYDFSELNLDFIEGNVSLSGASVVGLSSVVDDLVIRLTIPARATFNVNATTIALQNGTYSLDALLNSTTSISGAGSLEGNITGPFASVVVDILVNLVTNRLSITNVSVDLGFEKLIVRAEDFAINGDIVEWEWLDENAVPLFESIWGEVKEDVQALAKDILNDLLKDCRVTDLIAGDYSCIFPTPGPTTTGNPVTGPTDDPETTTPSSAGLFSQISISELLVLLLASRYVFL